MEEKNYDLIENEDGTLTAVVHDGIICIEEKPFAPKPFEHNENVTVLAVPSTLESVFVCIQRCFPKLKKIVSKGKNPNWGDFSFKYGMFKSPDQPRENSTYFTKNQDGTLTLDVPEGIHSLKEFGWFEIYNNVSVLNFPASMEEIDGGLFYIFHNLKRFNLHPDNPHFIFENGILFSKDKKRIVLYQDGGDINTYKIPDVVEEIADGCFSDLCGLSRIDIGRNVRKIGNSALTSHRQYSVEKIYIPPTVTEFVGEIFESGGDDGGTYYLIGVVGGAKGSAIETYCNKRNITFVAVNEDEIEDFYAKSVEELRDYAKQQAEKETEFFIDESEKGYQMKFADGTLEIFVPDGTSMTEIAVSDTGQKISRLHREKVKSIIIGNRITELANLAFDDYENLETVRIGADVQKISPTAFSGRDETYSGGCANLTSITVDENNKWYKADEGGLYTYDMQTLVKYPPAKPDLYYQIDSRVRHIGPFAFHYAKYLQCLEIGSGVVSIGDLAFLNANLLRRVYIADSVTQLPEEFPFVQIYGYESPYRILGLVVGGSRDSYIQKYCADDGAHFHVIEEDEVEKFLAVPIKSSDGRDGCADPYLEDCEKEMIIDKHGNLIQVGEVGEELVFPEGVVSTRYRIDISSCKRVVIPSTMTHLWIDGFDGPITELEEFVVAEGNEKYQAYEGHLYTNDGTLQIYVPRNNNSCIIPNGTVAIGKSAFYLTEPLADLYIPSSVKRIEQQHKWDGLFYKAEVADDNHWFKSVDGSIFTADGKKLVKAKILENGYIIPEGTEVICGAALQDVKGIVVIPESVKAIEDDYGLICGAEIIRTPRGSYVEQYVKEHNLSFKLELTVDGEVVEEWSRPKPEFHAIASDTDSIPF